VGRRLDDLDRSERSPTMRKLQVITMLSLDGVMQAPGGPDEDREGGFAYGGWSASFVDEDQDRVMEETLGHPFDLLLGRRTYEIFSGYWPHHADDPVIGRPFNDATKYVVSRSSPSLDWGPAELIASDAAEGVAAVKATDGPELHVWGSGNLIQTLMGAGLIDEYRLWTFPVTIGTGKRLFADGTVPGTLRLAESSVTKSGVVLARYEVAGELTTGTVA
jgi:dihydrofolate reductase